MSNSTINILLTTASNNDDDGLEVDDLSDSEFNITSSTFTGAQSDDGIDLDGTRSSDVTINGIIASNNDGPGLDIGSGFVSSKIRIFNSCIANNTA